MLKQPLSDRLIAFGIAITIHAALGYALLLAARAGVASPARADSDAGKAIVVQFIPLDRPDLAHPNAGTRDDEQASANRPPEIKASAPGTETPAVIQSVAASLQVDDRDPKVGDPSTADVEARAMANLPNAEIMAFRARLQAHLARYRLYPPAAKDAGNQGVVFLHFTMNRRGDVIQAWVETSSGESAIDREALDAVRRAVPLPVLPAGFPETLDIRLPVTFKLS